MKRGTTFRQCPFNYEVRLEELLEYEACVNRVNSLNLGIT